MKNLTVVALLAFGLAACGGGGGGSTITPSTPAPSTPAPVTHYTAALHWQPAANVGISAIMRHSSVVRRVETTVGSGETIIIGSGNGGTGIFDPSSDPAYVTVSVSPEPSPQATALFTTTAPNVAITPLPAPNPSASPGAIAVADAPNVTSDSGTLTATIAGTSASDNVLVFRMLTLDAPKTGNAVAPDAVGFSFDSSCVAQPQTTTAASDIYVTYGTSSSVTYPNGGIALAHGYDVSTLAATDWQNAGTSVTLDGLGNAVPADDTIIFKTSTGRIVFIGLNSWSGNDGNQAFLNGLYGCLN